jgi:hypothetical protein
MSDNFRGQVDVQLGPEEVIWARFHNIENLPDWRVLEPREIFVG